MLIKTLFHHEGRWEKGEVELHALPGVPNLHFVGLPDSQIRESGIKLKAALKSCGWYWPRGSQIVVNLRPNYFRKSSAGVELAIAMGILALTGQLSEALREVLVKNFVYGEVTLDGRVLAPHDISGALRFADQEVLTGTVGEELRSGRWAEIESLKDLEPRRKERFFDWENYFVPPERLPYELHEDAAKILCLAVHMNLHVLLAGPQGSGKSTWARVLFSLTEAPDPEMYLEREELVGREDLRWRPFEQPHHSITALGLIGGGVPIRPGVITRAHGGLLVMDEFLEFNQMALESLREPLECGHIEIARKGLRDRLPARFQLIGTTNLCPCGKLSPGKFPECPMYLNRCRSVVRRLSGPLLDRFDVLVFTHRWNAKGRRVGWWEMREQLDDLRQFRAQRGEVESAVPNWVADLNLNHRRLRSLLRVARGLADLDHSKNIQSKHFQGALHYVVDPVQELAQLFA